MGKLAIEIKTGETFWKAMRLKDSTGTPIPTAGATITSQIRKASDNSLIAEFDVSLLSDDWFKLQLEPDVTAELQVMQGLFWDVRFEKSDGVVIITDRDSVTIVDTMTEA